MDHATLGRTGVTVSRLALGTANLGWTAPESESFAILDRALDAGVNFLDTADTYGGGAPGEGRTEALLGRWLAADPSRRGRVVLATKTFHGDERGRPNARGLSAYRIRQACEDSLRRLRTDRIDLYQMHEVDPATPWDEIWQAMDQLVRDGKVIYVGASNFPAWRLAQASAVASARHLLGLVSHQAEYNLAARAVEHEVLDACEAHGIGVLASSPLGGGLFASPGEDAGPSARRRGGRVTAIAERRAEELSRHHVLARELGLSPSSLALAWLLARPRVTSVLAGPRTAAQLDASVAAAGLVLSREVLARLDDIWGPRAAAPPGPSSVRAVSRDPLPSPMDPPPRPARPPCFPRTVGVVGGGTAGYFAALSLKRRFPELEVTLIESSAVPIIGVGEATTTLMPPFLHRELGLDIVEMFRAVRPTFKLGIKFIWGPEDAGWFTYPFGDAWPLESFAFEGDLRPQSLCSLLIGEERGPVVRAPDGALLSLLPSLKFGYHLDNAPFVAYLARAAATAGIAHLDVMVEGADLLEGGEGIAALRTADGRRLAFDFYVDATGFRSLLLEQGLGSPFQSYAASLFCDRAIVATLPQRGPIEPCTTAETMDAGWCWRIPVGGEDHRGYVHASAFLDEDRAVAEMRAKNPEMGEPRTVRFRSGRHRDFWVGNVVGVGNAYGFVEPLESTALHMIILELGHLRDGLGAWKRGTFDGTRERANQAVGAHWDYLRDFLAVHYRFNRRLDTPFWRAAREEVDVSGMTDLLDRFRREGPWLSAEGRRFAVGDPTFGYAGLMMMLLGQRAAGSEHTRPAMDREAWATHLARYRGVASRALSHREALEALAANPAMLTQFVTSPGSWCNAQRRPDPRDET